MNNSNASAEIVLSAEHIHFSYRQGKEKIKILEDINLKVGRGESMAIVGSSGSGKSTLLHVLGGLDLPDGGRVQILGQELSHQRSDAERSRMRNHHLGFVYQFHHLLPEFSTLENVAMPLLIRGEPHRSAEHAAAELLCRIGLGERLNHKPEALSGGERQRAAIARALIARPDCLLADEPTGNLDHGNAEQVFDLLLQLNEELGTALIVVTHDLHLARRLQAQYRLHNKQLHPCEA